jgi:molybdopterin-guanine dinucleotide biosynthesis protein B
LAPGDPTIVAVAADYSADGDGRPVFELDDVTGLADFIAAHVGLPRVDG